MNKNILHIISGRSGGAAKGAVSLHNELVRQKVNSNLLLRDKLTDYQENTLSLSESITEKFIVLLLKKAEYYFSLLHRPAPGSAFSIGIFGSRIMTHPAYKAADIVHLHWINQGMLNISEIRRIDKPIVWTLRDMWPFTGGCHYSLDCNGYMSLCERCPRVLRSFGFDVARFLHTRKMDVFTKKHIHWVAISHWMKEIAKKSSVCRGNRVSVIHNGISLDDFFPLDKRTARKALNLPADIKIVLVGAQNLKDSYKGFSKFIDCLPHVQDDCHFVFFGGSVRDIVDPLNISYSELGFLSKSSNLRQAYSAADVFVFPSVQEAFGKTVIEAMACGTPVVAFDSNGPKDVIDHMKNGYLARPFVSEELAKGINWLIDTDQYPSISQTAIKRVKEMFNISIIAKEYIELYSHIPPAKPEV